MRRLSCFLAIGFLFTVSPDYLYAEILYIKSDNAKLRAQESSSSPVLQKLNAGTPVKVLVKNKRFYKVALSNGKEGWVFKFKITSKKPSAKEKSSGFAEILAGSPKIKANESTSASSIRGLSPASENYAKNKGLSANALKEVEDMENYQVQPQDIEQFLKDGGLGEFAP